MTTHEHLCVGDTADIGTARRAAQRAAMTALGEERAHDVELVVSELVTNALEYGGDGFIDADFTVDESGRFVVRVASSARELPVAPDRLVGVAEASGRGLHIVEVLSDDLSITAVDGRVDVVARFDPR